MFSNARDIALSGVEGLILDLDGTLHNSGAPTPGAVELVAWLRRKNIPFVFCTQDPDYGEAVVAERLRAAGFDADASDIVTGGATIVAEIGRRHNDAPVEMIVSRRQFAHLTGRGLRAAIEGEVAPSALLGIYDGFSHQDLERGCAAAWRGAALYAVAYDRAFRMPTGLIPGVGAFVAAVEHVTGRRAEALGKPGRAIAEACLAKLNASATSVLVVGDSLDADIAMGRRIGARTALVMTGSTSRADAEAAGDEARADWTLENVGVLFEALQAWRDRP